MKCPVCDNVNTSMVCLKCGFDSSRDYERYPTLGPVGNVSSISGLREKWVRTETAAEPPKKNKSFFGKAKKTQILSLLITLTYVITLSLGIWIGVGLGEKRVYQETQPWKNNILRSDPVMDVNSSGYLSDSEAYQSAVFGSPYRRDQISSVTFLDTLAACPSDAWDVSEGRNRSVMAWVKPNGEQFDLYIGARGGVSAGMSCETLFAGYKNAVKITFGGAFHTENVKTMDRMFYHCRSLTTLELDDQFNTSKVRDMNMMFYGCESLSMLSLGDCFDTSQVSNMHSMFSYCNSLDALYLSDCFVTTNANTHNMFFLCPAVESYQHLLN